MTLTRQQIKHGCWHWGRGWPPESLRSPDEYDGDENLNVVCTQLPVSQSEQRRLVKSWCEALPGFSNVKNLWFSSRVSQPMFDAACQMPGLEGLYVKWSGIKDISAVTNLSNLKYFHLGDSAQVESIDCLGSMSQLVVLHLYWIKKISDLGPLSDLTQLEGLAIEGSMDKTQVVDSLEPLAGLHELKYLFLANLKARDNTLLPLRSLQSLENLRTALWWDEKELSQLKRELPNLKYGTAFENSSYWLMKIRRFVEKWRQ